MAVRYLPIDWKEYHALARNLAASLLSQTPPFDLIVAISRGGLTLGHLLSDFLRIPIATITIQSYTDIQTHGEVTITEKLRTPIRGKRVILVDDVADSGKTMKRAMSYLKKLRPADITTATMFYKPHSDYRPDIYTKQTSAWILFPYELTEMIFLITRNMEKEGKSKTEIQTALESLGYTPEEITFVRKHFLVNNSNDGIA
jgi:hypoxanthine phosphoribosyltransferase